MPHQRCEGAPNPNQSLARITPRPDPITLLSYLNIATAPTTVYGERAQQHGDPFGSLEESMANPVSVSRLESKSHDKPDESRTPPKTRVDVVRLEGFTLGRFTFEPGWRWSECVKPVAGTDTC